MTAKKFDVVFARNGQVGTYTLTVRAGDKTSARIIAQDMIRQAEPGQPWTVKTVMPYRERALVNDGGMAAEGV